MISLLFPRHFIFLLINSANDAAVLIAEGVGGSVENFCEMMNEEALALGATNSHFVNPHGLTDDNHYTTVYDMYLIMNEAIKFEVFREIIHMDSYTTVYHDKNRAEKEITVNSTNYYFIGKADPPSGITILGGKKQALRMLPDIVWFCFREIRRISLIFRLLCDPMHERTFIYPCQSY